MQYKLLGKTGVLVSEICLGAMTFGGKGYWQAIGQLPQEDVNKLVRAAIDKGVNFIDTANAYSEGLSEILWASPSRKWAFKGNNLLLPQSYEFGWEMAQTRLDSHGFTLPIR